MLWLDINTGLKRGTWRPVEQHPSRRRQLQPLKDLRVHLRARASAFAALRLPASQLPVQVPEAISNRPARDQGVGLP